MELEVLKCKLASGFWPAVVYIIPAALFKILVFYDVQFQYVSQCVLEPYSQATEKNYD